jgi:D-alanyl-D-alanine carboxypeptidase (penicillin-binding protein 5/6)
MATLTSGSRTRTIDNRNGLVQRYPFVSGVKTGHTQGAGYVLVGSGAARGGRVITVTLGAPSEAARDADTLALLRWGLEQFRRKRVVRAGRELAKLDVNYRDEDAPVGAARPVTLVLRTGERATTALDAPDELDGPLDKGARVGWVEVKRDGETVRRVPLVTLADVEGATFLRKVVRALGTLLIVAILLGIVLLVFVAVRRRRGEG